MYLLNLGSVSKATFLCDVVISVDVAVAHLDWVIESWRDVHTSSTPIKYSSKVEGLLSVEGDTDSSPCCSYDQQYHRQYLNIFTYVYIDVFIYKVIITSNEIAKCIINKNAMQNIVINKQFLVIRMAYLIQFFCFLTAYD